VPNDIDMNLRWSVIDLYHGAFFRMVAIFGWADFKTVLEKVDRKIDFIVYKHLEKQP